MKIAHLGDFHIGKRIEKKSRNREIQTVLEEIVTTLERENVKVALISGDIFDKNTPLKEDIQLFYNFLMLLKKIEVKEIIIISGNHDKEIISKLANPLLEDLGVRFIYEKSEIRNFKIEGESLTICALPYISDTYLRSTLISHNEEEKQLSPKERYINIYQESFRHYHQEMKNYDGIKIFMGHLYLEKAMVGNSERMVSIEDSVAIPVECLEGSQQEKGFFHYYALGHIHKMQKVPDSFNNIYYCGSPFRVDFGEAQIKKGFYLFDTLSQEVIEKEISSAKNLCELDLEITSYDDVSLYFKENVPTEDNLYKIRLKSLLSLDQYRIRKEIEEIFGTILFRLEIRVKDNSSREKDNKDSFTEDSLDLNDYHNFMTLYKEYKDQEFKVETLDILERISKQLLS